MKLLKPLLAFAFLAAPAFVQAQAAAPATRPSGMMTPKATPEQQKWIEEYNHLPTDQAHQKMSARAFNTNGTPNPDFGKPDPGFMKMHSEFLERSHQPAQVLFIGDSITQGWRGKDKGPNGEPSAEELFKENYGDKYQAANFGIGGDRTEHVLWRIDNGELDGFKNSQPKVVVIMIGTNDSQAHTPEEIAAGTTAVVKAVHEKLPESKILLLSIFPRGKQPSDPLRQKVWGANEILKKLDGSMDGKVKYLELWKQFLGADDVMADDIMPKDFLHPKAIGYKIWVDTMNPVLEEMLK